MKKFIAILTSMIFLTACQGQSDSELSSLDQIRDADRLVMYTNAEFPPYEFMKGTEIVGVDIEIGRAIADRIGVELEVVNADFDGVVASVTTGRADMAISGITITEERKQSVDFSIPYVDSVQYIIIPEGSDITYMEDLQGMAIGAQLGATGALFIQDEIDDGVLTDSGAELRTYRSPQSAVQDLLTGRIAAVVIDELVAIALANENAGTQAIPFRYASGEPVTEQFAVVVRQGNSELLEVINEVIEEMLADNLIQEYIEYFSARS